MITTKTYYFLAFLIAAGILAFAAGFISAKKR